MRCAAAVGINYDLSAGKAGVALRSADDKAAGRVYIILSALIYQLGRNAGLYDKLDHIVSDLLKAYVGRMLS